MENEIRWKDENHIVGEEKLHTADTGVVVTFVKRYTYKNIKYYIKVLAGAYMNAIGKWAVVEYDTDDPNTKLIADMLSKYGNSEWLYRDTLHDYAENWTLKQQYESMEAEAKVDIDYLDTTIYDLIVEHRTIVKNLTKFRNKVKKIWGGE